MFNLAKFEKEFATLWAHLMHHAANNTTPGAPIVPPAPAPEPLPAQPPAATQPAPPAAAPAPDAPPVFTESPAPADSADSADSAYPVDGAYSYADDNGLIAIKALDDLGIAKMATRYGIQDVIDDPAKFKLNDAAKRKLQANLNSALLHVASPQFVSQYTLDGTGLYITFEQAEGGPGGTMKQGAVIDGAQCFPGDNYDPVANKLLWKAPRLSDIPQFIENCRKSGVWPIIDHSHIGPVATS